MDEQGYGSAGITDGPEPIQDTDAYGAGVGGEAYMLLAVLGICLLVFKFSMIFWIIVLVVAAFYFWRLSRVWPPARRWWLQGAGAWRETFKRLSRFVYLSTRPKTDGVNFEMAQLQGIMAARKTTLLQPSTLFTPVYLMLGGVVAFLSVLAWALWMHFFTIPARDRSIELARSNSAVAVGANQAWEVRERSLKNALDQANATIIAQQKDAVSRETSAFNRGRSEGLRIRAGRAKQKELEDDANSGRVLSVDPDRFLRDIGVSTGAGGDDASGSGSPETGAATEPPAG
jgi:hypothetical protein